MYLKTLKITNISLEYKIIFEFNFVSKVVELVLQQDRKKISIKKKKRCLQISILNSVKIFRQQ